MEIKIGFVEGKIKDWLVVEGFYLVGIILVVGFEFSVWLSDFFVNGYYGIMDWLVCCLGECCCLNILWLDVKLIIVVVMNYGFGFDFMIKLVCWNCGNVLVYVLGLDYYDLFKKCLKIVVCWIVEEWCEEVKVFVDIVFVMEKFLVVKVGFGW